MIPAPVTAKLLTFTSLFNLDRLGISKMEINFKKTMVTYFRYNTGFLLETNNVIT